MQGLSVAHGIAGHSRGGIESEHVAALFRRPEGEAGNHRGSRARGQLGKPRARAGWDTEEIDERALLHGRILVDQYTDGLVGGQRLNDAARVVLLAQHAVAESVRRRSTRRSISGLSSGRTTTLIGAASNA